MALTDVIENYEIVILELFMESLDGLLTKTELEKLFNEFLEYFKPHNITPSLLNYTKEIFGNLLNKHFEKKLRICDQMLLLYKNLYTMCL